MVTRVYALEDVKITFAGIEIPASDLCVTKAELRRPPFAFATQGSTIWKGTATMITPEQIAEQRAITGDQIMTPAEQLRRWVAGESVHNGPSPDRGECCPDFSCCCPEIHTPMSERPGIAARLSETPEQRKERQLAELRKLVPEGLERLDWDRLNTQTAEALMALGMRVWETKNVGTLLLFPQSWYWAIPDGLPITTISWQCERFRPGSTDWHARYGFLAYGVLVERTQA